MDVESAFLARVLLDSDLISVFEAKITSEFFEDPDNVKVFDWVRDYYSRYSKVPTRRTVRQEFPSYEIYKPDEPLDYYIDALRKRRKEALLTETIQAAVAHLREGDVDDAQRALAHGQVQIGTEVSVLRDTNLIETYEARLENYRMLRENPGMRGIPSGFQTIDLATGGFQAEQLVTIVGPPKAGKSTIMLCCAIAAHNAGYVPMFIGFEMSNEEQEARHDAIRAHIDYQHLLHGRMTTAEERKLEKSLGDMKSMQPFILSADITSATTMSAIGAKVEQYNPDIVFIDGAYLMDAEIPGVDPGSPQALTNITRTGKRLAQRLRKPIVISTQVLEWKYSKRQGITSNSIGYSSSFAQDSDVILGVETVEGLENVAKLSIVIARSAPKKSTFISFDWQNGEFTEASEEEVGAGGNDSADDI